ncbi:MAG: hypothetical protein A2008_01295 [Candidatus Wallbacteria bacterium GWC2_49_35]|uniref:Uncharacterized protein n=1 Tax=Candidatus Wallbacteria bacterium GWC2_49_35 TaxID=1817813 RepID=A0A1F7WQ55_9BACT|nr:MAG: hypothetical protein A2008_01295 [Candidatus Wallbacteria bacterium GWC2_49_35]
MFINFFLFIKDMRAVKRAAKIKAFCHGIILSDYQINVNAAGKKQINFPGGVLFIFMACFDKR